MPDTDRNWELLGEAEPYWAVISHDEYRGENLTPEAVDAFYETGESYTNLLFQTIRDRVDPEFAPKRALDFGCGVGRVALPLAKRCEQVVGVDVAPGMLKQARARCSSVGTTNARFVAGDDFVGGLEGEFDLIHAFIVMQHIPPQRGTAIVRRLIGRLAEHGVCAIHFGYSDRGSRPPGPEAPLTKRIRHRVALAVRRVAAPVVSRIRPRVDRSGPAPIYSYPYDLNALFRIAQEAGARRVHVEYTDHGGLYGVIMFFRLEPEEPYIA